MRPALFGLNAREYPAGELALPGLPLTRRSSRRLLLRRYPACSGIRLLKMRKPKREPPLNDSSGSGKAVPNQNYAPEHEKRARDGPQGEVAKVAARWGAVRVGQRAISRPVAALLVAFAQGRSETL